MGLLIVAPVHHEMDCLKLVHAYEQVTDWTGKRLPTFSSTAKCPLLARSGHWVDRG
jgi:hypothetical protein